MGRAQEILERLLKDVDGLLEMPMSEIKSHPLVEALHAAWWDANAELERAKVLGEQL
jgi:hypothetical protein